MANRKQRRAYGKVYKAEIQEIKQAIQKFETKVSYRNIGKFVFLSTPSKSILGFYGVQDYGNYVELFSVHFYFRSYSIGKIK